MTTASPSLFERNDTILGACEGIGEDFGFNAQILRVALAAMLFWNPFAAVGIYAALAVTVFVSRRLFPEPAVRTPAAAAPALPAAVNDTDLVPTALAA